MSRLAADVPSALFVRALEALPLFIKIFEPRTNAFETISDYGQKSKAELICLTSCQMNNINHLIDPTQTIRIFSSNE